jgi:hypothetical protein
MTSFRQIEANRRNALKSTGPVTAQGKQRSRCNKLGDSSGLAGPNCISIPLPGCCQAGILLISSRILGNWEALWLSRIRYSSLLGGDAGSGRAAPRSRRRPGVRPS